MPFVEELRSSLQEFLTGANIEIREKGSRISPQCRHFVGKFAAPKRSRCCTPGQRICNVTRRVLAIAISPMPGFLLPWNALAVRSPSRWKWYASISFAARKNSPARIFANSYAAFWPNNFRTKRRENFHIRARNFPAWPGFCGVLGDG
jgi:hypothetical protein